MNRCGERLKSRHHSCHATQRSVKLLVLARAMISLFRVILEAYETEEHKAILGVALRSKLLCTFFRPAHTWRQYANSFGLKTLKCAPSSGGKLLNYSGQWIS